MTLVDQLRSWPAEDLAHLLTARPDLLAAADRGFEAMARKAATPTSLARVLVKADVGMLVVADAVIVAQPATVDQLDELLGTDDLIGVAEAIERLRRTGLVTIGDGGVIEPVGALDDLLHRPLGLGPPFRRLADHLDPSVVRGLAERLGIDTTDPSVVGLVADSLCRPDAVQAILTTAPADTVELLGELVQRRSPAIPLPTGYPYRHLPGDDPLAWLLDNGLVVAVTDRAAELPRELVIAAHPDGLAPTAALRPIEPAPVIGLDAPAVAATGAARANRVLDAAETVLELVGRNEVSVRKAGGVGPRELRRLADRTPLQADDLARVFELVDQARLLRLADGTLSAGPLAEQWWALPRRRRYLALVRAWLTSDRFLAQDPPDGSGSAAPVALHGAEPLAAVAAARTILLDAVAAVDDGLAYHPAHLAASVVWCGPNLWGPGEPPPEELVDRLLGEAELLGLVAEAAPTPLLRALLCGDEGAVEREVDAALASDQETFVLQSDLTALAFGPLGPTVARPLTEMAERPAADRSDHGGTPAYRFTESSIRRAFDRGWTAESITAFLDAHALAGVPQPLAYLIDDVARRYGTVKVMPAQSIIVTADDITAVEIASGRLATRIGLRLVAPTVLTAPLDPVAVIEALRSDGRFPVLDGSTVVVDAPSDSGSSPDGAVADGRAESLDLPVDWTGPPLPTGPHPDEVSEAVANLLAPDDR